MGFYEYYEEHLESALDENGDVMPPWAKFPTIARYSIGWRMGGGEDWRAFFNIFERTAWARRRGARGVPSAPPARTAHVGQLGAETARTRKARRAAPAGRAAPARELTAEGLIGEDACYRRYVELEAPRLPWSVPRTTPVKAARYSLRPLWFWTSATGSGVPPP